jgi:hypothetical protein
MGIDVRCGRGGCCQGWCAIQGCVVDTSSAEKAQGRWQPDLQCRIPTGTRGNKLVLTYIIASIIWLLVRVLELTARWQRVVGVTNRWLLMVEIASSIWRASCVYRW